MNACHVILRRKQVELRTGLRRSNLYDKISKGAFPAPISLGARAVGWLESDINNWLNDCVTKSKNVVRLPNHEVSYAA